MKRTLASLLVLGLAVQSARALDLPSGSLRATGAADLLLNKRKPRYYNEVWSWQVLFDNGTQASLNFTYARLGFKDPVCGADLSLAGFKGRNYAVGREYPEDRLQQQGNPLRLQIHPDIWFQGQPTTSHRLHFATTKNEGYFLDLEFSDMVAGASWGNGVFGLKKGDLGVAVTIPMARVKGRLAVGPDTLEVQGWAVMEHMRQTALLGDLVDETFRGFRTGPEPVYLNVFKEKDKDWAGFGIVWKDGKPNLVPASSVKIAAAGGVNPPTRVELVGSDGTSIAMDRKSIGQANSILDGMEGVTRWVVKTFMGDVRMSRGLVDGGFYQYVKVKR
ncbi:MAG: hypothetical protein H6686_06645 [Fibrobacteria bacterium]|nr:hypothetical protein [Fibrobacteria bacterium]